MPKLGSFGLAIERFIIYEEFCISAIAVVVATLPLLYFAYQRAKAVQHKRELQVCIEKFEQIRIDAAKLPSVDLYSFQKYQHHYDWVSSFEGGLAAFSRKQKNQKQKGFVDFNNNIVLEYKDSVRVDGFPWFGGFENGRAAIFVYEYEYLPWGFLLPYGNPVPRIHGTIDCTGKVTLPHPLWHSLENNLRSATEEAMPLSQTIELLRSPLNL